MMFNAGTVDALSVEDCMPASKHSKTAQSSIYSGLGDSIMSKSSDTVSLYHFAAFNVLAGSHSPMQDFNTQSTVESVMDTVLSSDPMVERLKFSFVELQEVTYHGIPAENSAAEMAFLDSIVGDLVQDAAAGSDMVPASFANPSFMAPDDGFRVFASAGSLHVCAEASCNVIARKAVGDEVGDEDSIDVMMAPKPTITPAQDESGAKASSGPALNSMGILFSIQADQECVAADEPMKPGVVREPVRSSFDNDQVFCTMQSGFADNSWLSEMCRSTVFCPARAVCMISCRTAVQT